MKQALMTVLAVTALQLSCSSHSEVATGPRESLRAYAQALNEGRADAAYQLLSNEAKRSISLEAFRRIVKENPDDVKDIAQSLSRAGSDPVVTATLLAPSGDKLVLIYEDGRWRIDGTGIDRYGQGSPRQAIEGFLRAFERRRYDVLMRYVPAAEREGSADTMWNTTTKPKKPAPAKDKPAPAPDAGADGGAPPAPQAGEAPPAPQAGEALTAEMLKEAWEGDQKEYISRIVQAIKSALPTAKIEETEDTAVMPYGAGGSVVFVREDGLWKIKDLL